MAPNANIVDVQVLDQNGNGRVSSVIRGLEWVVAHQAQFNIKVVNMSFGAPPMGSYMYDPFAAAAEVAWKRGLTVVVAAGNAGPSNGTVMSPGIDPYVITVGSTDDQGSLALNTDTLGWWSSWGTPNSTARPDLVAPGRRVASIYVPGSTLATLLASHVVYANPVVYGSPLGWKSLTYLGTNWSGYTWLTLPWNDATWDNIAWDNIAWDNVAWDNIAWDQTGWDNIAWDNIAWDSSEWDNIAWDSFSFD